MSLRNVILSASLVLFANPASGQTIDEPTLSLEGARKVAAAAESEARRRNMTISLSILDRSGDPILFLRMDGAAPGSVSTATGKARTAAAWGIESRDFETMLKSGILAPLSLDGLVLIEGGVPIVIDGRQVGSLGVSGGASADDGAVARAAMASISRQ